MAYSRGGVQSMEIDDMDTTTSRKRRVYSESNFVIHPSPSKGKGQPCSAQVECSKAQKAKMAIVKIERHDALIDTEDDEVRANPFLQQEPHIEEHDVPFLYITNLFDITSRLAIEGCVLNNYEGSAIKTKNKADGGTSPFSLLGYYLDQNFEIYANSTRGELLVANGSAPKDRVTLTFVNDCKEDKRLQSDLLQTYKTQVESLDYGKQVFASCVSLT
ncbi:hypothetical protein GOP47_0007742 [Adiantum capillus-veneris]|uniref:Uncharacterized protein n=1 Tax=Adiantum capillus-veneris TaxID=13818 RepID=A0A9D4ZJI4_ADICA|nr:hypothetical protein GOP47_0007742 [Adiantum capillus-veneris]